MPWSISHAAEEVNKPPQQTVGEDVIGTPKPAESRYEYCFSGVLLPNKDNFYTVRDGLLSEYQIEPFKRVRSVELETDFLTGFWWRGCNMWTNYDHSTVIVYDYDNILLLLDAMTGKLLKSRAFSEEMTVYSARIEGDRLFILAKSKPYVYPYTAEGHQLLVWDLDSLEQDKVIDLSTVIESSRRFESPPFMSVYGGRIYLFMGTQFLILNSKSLRLELRSPTAGINVWASIDLNDLYFPISTVIRDFVADQEIDLQITERQAVLFDQETRAFTYVERIGDPGPYKRIDSKELVVNGYWPIARPRDFARTSTYAGSPEHGIVKSPPDLFRYGFHQYPEGEAVMLKYIAEPNEPRRIVGLSLTPGARKYLNMKIEGGAVVPINDATLEFYQSGSEMGMP